MATTLTPPRPAPAPPGDPGRRRRRALKLAPVLLLAITALPVVLLAGAGNPPNPCGTNSQTGITSTGGPVAGGQFAAPLTMQPGKTYSFGATQFGGPADPTSGTVGSSGTSLAAHPDSFAELSTLDANPANGGTFTFQDANALGSLPYGTNLRISNGGRSLVVSKEDTGYGQGPGAQGPGNTIYRIDVWYQAAEQLGISKTPITAQLAPASGTGNTLGQTPASTNTPAAAPAQAALTVDADAADAAAAKAPGGEQVGWAVVSPAGQVIAQHDGDMPVDGASITKAMLLVAELEQLGTTTVPGSEAALLEPMIESSSDTAGSAVFHQVGAAAVEHVAHQAGMTGFQLDTSDTVYTLGQSKVTALDQARLFARIDQLIPQTNRSWAMNVLSSISQADHWGILSAQLPGVTVTASKAGWKAEQPYPDATDWQSGVVNQAAQITVGGQTAGLAITTTGDPSQADGEEALEQVTTALSPNAGSTTTGADCTSGAPGADLPLQLTPGQTAKINPQTGIASAPEDSPRAVKLAIAAGNQLIDKPYVWGGGHADLNQLDTGYDCSGSSEYILHQAGLYPPTSGPASGDMENVFKPGPGQWITVYADSEHMWLAVAGIIIDTVPLQTPVPPGSGPRWQPGSLARQQIADDPNFVVTHPQGL